LYFDLWPCVQDLGVKFTKLYFFYQLFLSILYFAMFSKTDQLFIANWNIWLLFFFLWPWGKGHIYIYFKLAILVYNDVPFFLYQNWQAVRDWSHNDIFDLWIWPLTLNLSLQNVDFQLSYYFYYMVQLLAKSVQDFTQIEIFDLWLWPLTFMSRWQNFFIRPC